MACNWDLYEFRLNIYTAGKWGPGKFIGSGMKFFNLSFDMTGLGEFEGSNDYCDFKPVFAKLAAKKAFSFGFSLETVGSYIPYNYFDVLEQTTKLNYTPTVFPAAILYVHRKDRLDIVSQEIGPFIFFENIQIISTSAEAKTFGTTIKRFGKVTFWAGAGKIWGPFETAP